jgi:hypothetical protein
MTTSTSFGLAINFTSISPKEWEDPMNNNEIDHTEPIVEEVETQNINNKSVSQP